MLKKLTMFLIIMLTAACAAMFVSAGGYGGADAFLDYLSRDGVIEIDPGQSVVSPVAAAAAVALPTVSRVFADGKELEFEAYNINGYNYFKLRDLAFALDGTPKRFNVEWDGDNDLVVISRGEPYRAVGGEMSGASGDSFIGLLVKAKIAVPGSSGIYLDGFEIEIPAFSIDGYNYFKLRDVGAIIGFGVDWVYEGDSIIVDTSIGEAYEPGYIMAVYSVKEGDTLMRIALKYYGDGIQYKLIMEANDITNDNIHIGQSLIIPRLAG